MELRCDVLILGAGPAGSTLATRLARQGFHVVLADRKEFPRWKPCGEFLSPQCRPLLEELGVMPELLAAGTRLVHGMELLGFGHHGAGRFRRLPEAPPSALAGLAVRRERLDLALQQQALAAGTTWLGRHRFGRLLRNPGGTVEGAVLLRENEPVTVHARTVVGADGVFSPVAQALDVRRPLPWLDRMALVTHYEGVPEHSHAEVHFLRDCYFAATGVDNGLFGLNLIVDRKTLRQRDTADWDAFVATKLADAPALATRLQHARRVAPWRGIGPLACTTTAQVKDGCALVGDACGYVDPITGEGVWFALWGARALADALRVGFDQPQQAAAALRGYQRERAREIGPRLLLARLLQRGLRHPWLVQQFLHGCARLPALVDLLVTLTGDTVHPRDLARPSFWRGFAAAAS